MNSFRSSLWQKKLLTMARMGFVVSKEIVDKIEAYIRKKRMSGDIYYSKTNLIHDALNSFLSS